MRSVVNNLIMKHHRLVRRRVMDEGRTLRVYFEDGMVRDIDLIAESSRGPAFAPLRDPEYVRGVKRVWDGYLLQWPDKTTWSVEVLRSTGELVRGTTTAKRHPPAPEKEARPEPRAANSR